MLQGWVQIAVFVAVLVALVKPVGIYMARVFTNQRVFLSPLVGPIERLTYRVMRVRLDEGQDWKGYARSLIAERMEQTLGQGSAPVENSNAEHAAIVAAIKAHDPEGAESTMRKHLTSIRAMLFGDR